MYIPFFSLAANTSGEEERQSYSIIFKQQKTHLIEQKKNIKWQNLA
jgi:hypothetical protein